MFVKYIHPQIRGFIFSKALDDRWAKRLPDIALVYLLFSLSYFCWYLIEPSVPANDTNNYKGWWGYWDQGQYWKTAGELATGHLGQSQYWWGYPLLGAIFYKALPAHPFFIPNYVLGFVVVLFFYLMAVRFVTRIEALALTVVLILGSQLMMFQSLILPWNTIVTYAAMFSISFLLVVSSASYRGVYFCVFLVSLSTLVRPTDTPILFVYLASTIFFRFDVKTFIKLTGLAIVGILLGAVILALLNWKAFGQIVPPYVNAQKAVGMSLNGIGFRLYQLFVDGALIHGNSALPPGRITPTILTKMPLMVFSLAGAWLLWHRLGNRVLPLVAVCFGAIVFFATFNATGNPPHFWSFLLYHYFWWACVILSLTGYIFLREWVLHNEIPSAAKSLALLTVAGLAFIGFGEEATTYFNRSKSDNLDLVEMQQVGDKTQFLFKFQGDGEQGLRLAFHSPLPYHLTVPGNNTLISVEMNGEKWRYWKDFIVSQEGNTVNIHFYRSPPAGNTLAVITLDGLEKPELVSAQWIRIRFQPFATVHRLTNWLFGPGWTVGPSPYLALPYRVGDILKFGRADGNQGYLLTGWSAPEVEHVWSVKKNAQLRLGIDPGDLDGKGCAVDVDYSTFGSNSLSLSLNGESIGTPLSSDGQRQTARFSPCPNTTGHDVMIGLEVDHLRSPATPSQTGDHRQLGVAIFSIRIVKE